MQPEAQSGRPVLALHAVAASRTPSALARKPHHVRLSIAPATGKAQSFRWLVPGSAAPASDFSDAALPAARVFGWQWSGIDLAARVLQGAYGVTVTTSYEYACGYRDADVFGHYPTGAALPITTAAGSNGTAEAGRAGADRGTCLLPQEQVFTLEQFDSRALGLGGLTLSAHHVALPDGSVLFGGGGRSTAKLMPVSKTLADPLAAQPPPFQGVPLAQAATLGDGSL